MQEASDAELSIAVTLLCSMAYIGAQPYSSIAGCWEANDKLLNVNRFFTLTLSGGGWNSPVASVVEGSGLATSALTSNGSALVFTVASIEVFVFALQDTMSMRGTATIPAFGVSGQVTASRPGGPNALMCIPPTTRSTTHTTTTLTTTTTATASSSTSTQPQTIEMTTSSSTVSLPSFPSTALETSNVPPATSTSSLTPAEPKTTSETTTEAPIASASSTSTQLLTTPPIMSANATASTQTSLETTESSASETTQPGSSTATSTRVAADESTAALSSAQTNDGARVVAFCVAAGLGGCLVGAAVILAACALFRTRRASDTPMPAAVEMVTARQEAPYVSVAAIERDRAALLRRSSTNYDLVPEVNDTMPSMSTELRCAVTPRTSRESSTETFTLPRTLALTASGTIQLPHVRLTAQPHSGYELVPRPLDANGYGVAPPTLEL